MRETDQLENGRGDTGMGQKTLKEIALDLAETTWEPGAYECSCFSFLDVCRWEKQMQERSRKASSLLVCRLKEGDCSGTDRRSQMDLFQKRMARLLRRSDVYTRSGPDQVMVLLIGTDEIQAQTVVRKITDMWKNCSEAAFDIEMEVIPVGSRERELHKRKG